MGFVDEGASGYPIVNCDLADILSAPGVPAPAELARSCAAPAPIQLAERSAGTGPPSTTLPTAMGGSARRHARPVAWCTRSLDHPKTLSSADRSASPGGEPSARPTTPSWMIPPPHTHQSVHGGKSPEIVES